MQTLCFGGSFNPIHHGHLICARVVAEAGGFDRVLLIPSAQPPHKPRQDDIAPAEARLAMCRLAIGADPLFAVDDLELSRGGPSYTLDTVRALRARGWSKVHWLIGADMLNYLPNWHQPEQLLSEVQFVVMARPGHALQWDRLPSAFHGLKQQVVAAPLIDISATQIRERARSGRSIRYLVPETVAEYVAQHKLYRPRSI